MTSILAQHSVPTRNDAAAKPFRSLDSLSYPPDPLEEGLNALNDPLNRDQPKPLLRTELLAIGASEILNRMLSPI